MKQLVIIKLLVWFGWLSCIALAQLELSGAITGSVSFPHVGITCLGNLAVFITSILRKRLDLEMGARDFLATIPSSYKLKEIPDPESKEKNESPCISNAANEVIEVTTSDDFSVIMLSNSAGMTNCSIRQFMEYIANAHNVKSILLKYDTEIRMQLQHSCSCIKMRMPDSQEQHSCNCIKIRMPDSPYELPSLQCLEYGCHGLNRDQLLVKEIKGNLVKFGSAVCDALDFKFTTAAQKEPICICIPVSDDQWTKFLVRSFKYKDQQDKGAIVAASDALQSYLDKRREVIEDQGAFVAPSYALQSDLDKRREDRAEVVIYSTVSLLVIRFVEIFINLLLTGFFKVDGFSSSLAARRAVRSYVVDSKGNGLPANAFLTSALVVVKSDSVCQVLKFRPNILGSRTLLFIVGFVNLICSIAWAVVLIAFKGGVGKWYEIPSMPPSKPRVAVIIAAIAIGIGMDFFEISKAVMRYKNSKKCWEDIRKEIINRKWLMVFIAIVLEIVFAVEAGALGLNKRIGRWVYGALQVLVWVKWGIGSYLLGAFSPEYVPTRAERKTDEDGRAILDYSSAEWHYEGSLVYSSSFFLNAVLVGVMGNWAGVWSTWK